FLISTLVPLLRVISTGKADFYVLGPGEPLLAIVGEDTELPCRMSPNISAEGMELRWYRDQPSPAVHLHKNGEDVFEEQMVEYQGRTTFMSDHMARGEAMVRIHNVTVFDNGTYHCLFKEHTSYSNATFWLKVKKIQSKGEKSRSSQEAGLNPSLDPNTASPKLMVSENQKSVKRLLFEQDLPLNSRRFDQDPCIMAHERFWTGRYYWEVEVGDRKAWTLGVCLESLGRVGRIPKSPQHGLWAVEFYKKRFWALSYPRTPLSPPQPFRRVGIFLDCDGGEISFYHVTHGTLVYTFSTLSFPGALQPFLCLWTHDPIPLTLCPVVGETQKDKGNTLNAASILWSSLCVSLCLKPPQPFSQDTAIVLRTHPNAGGSPLEIHTLIATAKTSFPNKILVTGARS
uniref:Butyrophilin subfamily 1 member A1 n=1 Tax=Castor canadensis TaxID=51338 RepID=A0A8C0XPG6_CASCN